MKVVVFVINGLHCGPLGAYGNDWVGTNAFDRLAANGVVFDQHYADEPDAVGARRAWRTGRFQLPSTDAVSYPPALDQWKTLRSSGVTTALVRETPPPPGFAEDWDVVEIVERQGEEPALERFVEAAGEVLDNLPKRKPWLLWMEVDTLLPPWRFPPEHFHSLTAEPADGEEADELDEEQEDKDADEETEDVVDSPAEIDEEADDPLTPILDPELGPLGEDPRDTKFLSLQETYAAAVRYVDVALEALLDGLDDDVLLIVTSDRGVMLGEHGVVGVARPWLYEELIHLPLLMRFPGQEYAGQRIPALTQSMDLLPTLLELFGIPRPADLHAHSLLPLVRGEAGSVRDYAVSGLQLGLALEWALHTLEWSFLLPLQGEVEDAARPPQLYARPEDRWEVNDVRQHHLELCEHFVELLHAFAAATRQPGPLVPPKLRDVEAELATATPEPPPDAS